MKFAKLYERNGEQVLVKIDTNEDGLPEVRFFFQPEGLGVCSYSVSFGDDSSESWDHADAFFEAVTEEMAFHSIGKVTQMV